MREQAEHVCACTLTPREALVRRSEVDTSRMAAIGFCFGGTMSYELALTGADIKAAIGFHSGLKVTSPKNAANIQGKILTMIGAGDPYIPPEDRVVFVDMLARSGVDYTLTVYVGVVHSFTYPGANQLGRPELSRYDGAADRRSWAQMADLLAEACA
jgi:dienelactone hydrolase